MDKNIIKKRLQESYLRRDSKLKLKKSDIIEFPFKKLNYVKKKMKI